MKKLNGIYDIFTTRVIFNIYVWVIFFSLVYFPIEYLTQSPLALKISLASVLPLIPTVYINFRLIDNVYNKGKKRLYLFLLIILLAVVGIGSQLIMNWLLEPNINNSSINIFFDPIVAVLVSMGSRYFFQGMKLQSQLFEAEAKRYKAELDLLKYQINPHFFFNTLNNLFAMARKQEDDSTAKGIAKLSHLMRYIIYDCNVEAIELDKEIEQLNNFLELQRLRFEDNDTVSINFNTEGNIIGKRISPMLLIPFVENAFKHGISLANESPIDIVLISNTNELKFNVRNRINKLRKERDDDHSGIGLANVKRRLELLYPGTHKLDIQKTDTTFSVNLTLKL